MTEIYPNQELDLKIHSIPVRDYFRSLLQDCEIYARNLPQPIVEQYFPKDDFDSKADRFFSMSDKALLEFAKMTYPFYGREILDVEFFIELVDTLPEFIASIISIGYGPIISLEIGTITTTKDFMQVNESNDSDLSLNNFRADARSILGILMWYEDGVWESNNLKDEIGKIRDMLDIKQTHTDIRGCLQYHYNKFFTSSASLTKPCVIRIGPLYFQSDIRNKTLFARLCQSRSWDPLINEFEDITQMEYARIVLEDILFEHSLDELQKELDNDWMVDTERDDRIVARMAVVREEDKIESLFKNLIPKEERSKTLIQEPKTQYGSVDGLVLYLPEDQTTDQSPVYLDFISDDKKIADIKLSHMEAAFLYYLGAERKAGESYWLHAPEEHQDLLRKIWNSFSLPQYFEDELELESPKKDSSTWIWDFRNTNRKTLRNQIQRKIKYLQSEALDLNLITSIKSKSPSRGGNYKLNSLIKKFTTNTPSK